MAEDLAKAKAKASRVEFHLREALPPPESVPLVAVPQHRVFQQAVSAAVPLTAAGVLPATNFT